MTTPQAQAPAAPPKSGLAREMGLLGLMATGVCSMVGAGINVIPFMIQRNVPGIGPHVLPALCFAALPAVLAGLAYAILASAMPRAGGSYVYASRGLNPYLGFVASFSQWFSLCVAIGVVSYVLVPFLRDIAVAAGSTARGGDARDRPVRLTISLGVLWAAVARQHSRRRALRATDRAADVPDVHPRRRGDRRRVLRSTTRDFAAALLAREGRAVAAAAAPPLTSSAPSCRRRRCCSRRSSASIRSRRRAARRKQPGPQPAARHRHGRRLGRRLLHALHRRGVSRRAVAVHRRRSAAARPDGAGPAGISAAAVLDGGDRRRRRRWRWSRTCRRCCWRCRA